ncbi:hypothetical protein LTR15_007843 [Elasticomyces elasticus]|nr:hypothetical protein LTR15_007843 [Elasticomyces elasticus]
MPSQLDPNMSTAGQKGKASWRAAVPAQALLGHIYRCIKERTANFFNSSHMVRLHGLDIAALGQEGPRLSPSCKDEDGEDDLEHPGLFVSKATWKIIKNGHDAFGGEDCYRRLAITSCEEQKRNVLQFRA